MHVYLIFKTHLVYVTVSLCRWHDIGKSDCTSHCGPGYRTLDVHCMKYSVSKGLSVPVDDKYCADQQKPPVREPCHGDCLLTSWHYTEWSEV